MNLDIDNLLYLEEINIENCIEVLKNRFKNKKIYVLTDNRPKASMYEGKLGPVIHNLDNLSDDEISKALGEKNVVKRKNKKSGK